jgi:structural maintenance of chromosome 2
MALEVAAGGKLYQVVVDSHVTGKALLQRGRLQSRTTFVPLDQVRTCCVMPLLCDATAV